MQEKICAFSKFYLTFCNNFLGSQHLKSETKAMLTMGFAAEWRMQVDEK